MKTKTKLKLNNK